jgi:hypothetical protein
VTAGLHSDVVDAALSCASTLVGMEVVFISTIDDVSFRVDRLSGEWDGICEGTTMGRSDSFCARMLAGAPRHTSHAETDAAYLDTPIREVLGITSYVGVPIHDAAGNVIGTLCGIDRGVVEVDDGVVGVLEELASIISAHLAHAADEAVAAPDLQVSPREVVIRRTPHGWEVAGGDVSADLTSAMVLADLLADDVMPAGRPPRPSAELGEVERLRIATTQLEHALAARVLVEQAIGVLSERLARSPRDAFELLRKVARRGGVRVHDLSRQVVRSATETGVALPPELTRP